MGYFSASVRMLLSFTVIKNVAGQFPMPFQVPGQQMQHPGTMGQMSMMGGQGPQPYPVAGIPPNMPFPMPVSMSQPKLPVVVMPFRPKGPEAQQHNTRRHNNRRKHKKQKYTRLRNRVKSSSSASEETETDNSESSSVEFRTKKRGKDKTRARQVLTPVISYVTKDGYVVYQKKIKKETAKEWLDLGKKDNEEIPDPSDEEKLRRRLRH